MRRVAAVLFLAVLLATPCASSATTLFGLVDTGEIYSSSNNGATWTPLATLPVYDAVAIAAAASSTDLYLLTRSGSVYHSSTGGSSWSAVGAITASDMAAMTILPSGTILALTESGTLYASSDLGATFTGLAALTNSDWVSLARGPIGRLYALTRTGQAAQSLDDGATWTTVSAITTSNAVAIRRRGNELHVMNETGETYRSIDYGVTWTPVSALTSSSMRGLVEIGSTLIASTREGEVASTSNGTGWSWIGAINQLNVVSLGVDTPLATSVEPGEEAPRIVLGAPYPNPRGRGVEGVFPVWVPTEEVIRIDLFDAGGRLVATRVAQSVSGGSHALRWNPGDLAAGLYVARYVTGSGRSAGVKWTFVR